MMTDEQVQPSPSGEDERPAPPPPEEGERFQEQILAADQVLPKPCCDDDDKPDVKHTTTINLEGEYEGWYAIMDSDPDTKTLLELGGNAYPGTFAAANRLLVEWNFKDKWGVRVPPSMDGLIRIPRTALAALMTAYMAEFTGQLPNRPGAASTPTSTTNRAGRRNGTARRHR